ncbi:MAG: hypothetical protein IPH77_19135 [Ignavibacteria bacterium]|nr:hypothetical protein [Ignavibacteria bacterium]
MTQIYIIPKIELILLKELGMANWQPTLENKSIKNSVKVMKVLKIRCRILSAEV